MNACNPKFSVLSESHVRKVLMPDIYRPVKYRVKELLEAHVIWFSATTDMWSSCTQQAYLALTCRMVAKGDCPAVSPIRRRSHRRAYSESLDEVSGIVELSRKAACVSARQRTKSGCCYEQEWMASQGMLRAWASFGCCQQLERAENCQRHDCEGSRHCEAVPVKWHGE